MRIERLAICMAICMAVLAACCVRHSIADIHASFDHSAADSRFEFSYEGSGIAGELEGAMQLIEGTAPERGSLAFARSAEGLYGRIQAQWTMRLLTGGHGMGIAFLDVARHGAAGEAPNPEVWDEPNIVDAFGIGFDVFNPPGGSPFDALGNIYDRPQREVSLHVNETEIVNALSPVEIATNVWIDVHIEIVFITGGANVTVRFGDRYAYDNYFVPHLMPFESRLAFGARSNHEAAGGVEIDEVAVQYLEPLAESPAEPIRVVAFDHELITSHQQRAPGSADFTEIAGAFRGRVIATLTLAEPAGGFDPKARGGSFSIFDENHERFEVFRFVTPFGRGGAWHCDVSHLLPLLRGDRQMQLRIDTWEKGWDASVHFTFYPGETPLIPFKVINLWQGEPVIGDLGQPVDRFYNQRRITIDPRTDAALLRTTVTGHGMHPNTGNAAEFLPIERTITVRDTSFTSELWTTDNYLNPIRPQGGTWKYDRAGWGPGSIVRPWALDISRFLERGQEASFDYELASYVNTEHGQTSAPIHWTETQLILYELSDPQPNVYSCPRVTEPITVDGLLAEEPWQSGEWMLLTNDIRGREQARCRYGTAVRLLWDDEFLYVGARLVEPHINAELTDRDAIVYFDNDFEVFLDPGRDGINYFEAEVNALNTVFDLFIRQPYMDAGQADLGWNWTGMKTAIHAFGTVNDPSDTDQEWMIEMALPWSAMQAHTDADLPPRKGQSWGLNFSRVQWAYDIVDGAYVKNESRPEDNWVWNPIGTVNIHHPGHWGILQFD